MIFFKKAWASVVFSFIMTYFEGFSVNASRSKFVFLQVDPLQVRNSIKGICWDAADAVACRSEQVQLIFTTGFLQL